MAHEVQSDGRVHGVVFGCRRATDGRYLMVRRSQHVAILPGKVCFPGGGVCVGETQEAACAREAVEELGVTVTAVERVWRHEFPDRPLTLFGWRAELGEGELRPEPLEVAAVCDHAAAMFREQAEKKNIALKVLVEPGPPPVRQDAGKLHQILTNLLSNAVKFTPEGGRVTVRAASDGNELVLTVADTGVGIAPEEQGLIFEKFRQAANPLTREQGGTGLGLSIVRELAKLLGGDVALHSELGRGSTFTVRVAARLADEPLLDFELGEEPPTPAA